MGGFFITQVEGPIPASPRGFGCAGLGVGSWYSHPYSYGYPTYYGPTYYGHPLLRMNTDACLQSLFVPGALDGKEIMRSNNGRCLERNRKFADSPLERDGFELPVREHRAMAPSHGFAAASHREAALRG